MIGMHLLNWGYVRNASVRVPAFWFHSRRGKTVFFFELFQWNRCDVVCITVQQQQRKKQAYRTCTPCKKYMTLGIQMSTRGKMVNKCRGSQWHDMFNMQIENKTHRLHNQKYPRICVGNTVFSGVQSKQFADIVNWKRGIWKIYSF